MKATSNDARSFDQREIIKSRKNYIRLEWNILEDWILSRRIDRCIDIRFLAMGSGIGLRRMKITPRKSEL